MPSTPVALRSTPPALSNGADDVPAAFSVASAPKAAGVASLPNFQDAVTITTAAGQMEAAYQALQATMCPIDP